METTFTKVPEGTPILRTNEELLEFLGALNKPRDAKPKEFYLGEMQRFADILDEHESGPEYDKVLQESTALTKQAAEDGYTIEIVELTMKEAA